MQIENLLKEVRLLLNHYDHISDQVVTQTINKVLNSHQQFVELPLKAQRDYYETIFNAIRRLDVLQSYIEDSTVTEIMVNGMEGIYIEKNGRVFKTDTRFRDLKTIENLIQKIVSQVNRAVNTAMPIVDARLQDGSRVNVALPPIAINGPIITIRKFREKNFTMDELVAAGSLPQQLADYLMARVRDRCSIFISGGTGSGKTTFLNALSNSIPDDQRIVSIEDSAELRLDNLNNWVRLETRNANAEGAGQINIADLIRTALRMRPDRIIVGEVRGDEAIDMLQAMNTGHDGSLSTGHANSVEDMLRRIETMVYSAKDMPMLSIKRQIASAIDIIVHLSRTSDGKRIVAAVKLLNGFDGENYQLEDIYQACHINQAMTTSNRATCRVINNKIVLPERVRPC